MKVKDLMEILQQVDPNADVAIQTSEYESSTGTQYRYSEIRDVYNNPTSKEILIRGE